MLLQRLNEVGYHMEQESIAQREEVPSGYTQQAIAWIIQLDTQGNLEGVIPTSAERPGKDKGIKLTVPYLRRSGKNIKPQLLADKAEFVLGLPEKDEKRAQIRHCDFVALIQACAERTGEESVRAVVTFLNRNDLRNTCIPHFSERIACERIPALIFTMRCRHEHDTPRHRI
jgi:CRISPR-associated protein (Cas_Csd1)